MKTSLPSIPAKRYFSIGEVSELCGVKPYVLRYWEQEFSQLRPMKRRGNRRYYQHHELLLIRRIRELLYDEGFTISGARNQLLAQSSVPSQERPVSARGDAVLSFVVGEGPHCVSSLAPNLSTSPACRPLTSQAVAERGVSLTGETAEPEDWIRLELGQIRDLLLI